MYKHSDSVLAQRMATEHPDREFICVQTENELADMVHDLEGHDTIALDTETTKLHEEPNEKLLLIHKHPHHELLGVCLAATMTRGYYMPIRHTPDQNKHGEKHEHQMDMFTQANEWSEIQLPERLIQDAVIPIITTKNLVGHNSQFEIAEIKAAWGVDLPVFLYDSLIGQTLLNENIVHAEEYEDNPEEGKVQKNKRRTLKWLTGYYYSHCRKCNKSFQAGPTACPHCGSVLIGPERPIEIKQLGINLKYADLWDATLYAAADPVNNLRVREAQRQIINGFEQTSINTIHEFSLQDLRAHVSMAHMENSGLGVDRTYLEELEHRARIVVEGRRQAVIGNIPEFHNKNKGTHWKNCNWSSPKGLAHILFDPRARIDEFFDPREHGWGLQPVLKGKWNREEKKREPNRSTDSDHLILIRKNRTAHAPRIAAFIDALLKHRKIQKLHSTYMKALPDFMTYDNALEQWRVYPKFNATATVSGRSSSNYPNLQNMPKDAKDWDIRRMFIPRPGHVFIAADWSNMEMRIAAALSGDQALKNVFLNNIDMHRQTAAAIFNILYDEVNSDQRSTAKPVNYGSLYGISAEKLAIQIEIQTGIKISVTEAQEYIDAFWDAYARLYEWVGELHCQLRTNGVVYTYQGRPRHVSDNPTESEIRSATNTVIQGTGADYLKEALWQMFQMYHDDPQIWMPAQIHDEIVMEAPYNRAIEVHDNLVNAMYRQIDDMPIPVDGEIKLSLSKNSRHLTADDLDDLQQGANRDEYIFKQAA